MQRLVVWAERVDGFVPVGSLMFEDDGTETFGYFDEYLSQGMPPIFPTLPLRSGPQTQQDTRAAFSSLGPEGVVGRDIRAATRAGRDTIVPILSRLNRETVGALAFTTDETPPVAVEEVMPMGDDFLQRFARDPERTATDTLLHTRLSLNGAVAKVGVAQGDDGSWLLPCGTSPSTHILKSGSPSFPDQMANEALCMRSAKHCGFDDVPQTTLIGMGELPPLLAIRRFDRAKVAGRPNGLPSVMRLHQADFCQMLGIPVDALKYVPSDELVEGYTTSSANLISRESGQRFGDRVYLFSLLAFDYAIGNCDNHLKNLSMTWSADWQGKSLSPAYDLTCTTIYPDVSREMGMGIGRHRVIDKVDADDLLLMARHLGIRGSVASQSLAEVAQSLPQAISIAADELSRESGVDVHRLANAILSQTVDRIEVLSRAAG